MEIVATKFKRINLIYLIMQQKE